MTSAAPPTPKPAAALSAGDARRIALRAQGLLGAPDRRGGVRGVLRRLGAVQLDTISVLARSHELVPYARLGAVGRGAVEEAYWGGAAFEYWSHAACVLPVEEWPLFAFRRRAFTSRGHRWHRMEDAARSCAEVRARLRADGPLTATDLGGARRGGPWWDWSETKIAIEWLLDVGEVVCTERRGWKRVYDLAERAVPPELLAQDPDDATCLRRLVGQAGAALGVATRADLADYHRLRTEQVDAVAADSGLVPVEVEGWGRDGGPGPAWADPAALGAAPRGRHRTTLLSPFDSLIWDRARTERVFGFAHRLEAYVPRERRVHGYFAMPLLAGGRLVGRVDPAREGRTLVARQASVESPAAVAPMAQALREAAEWVGCDAVTVERVVPESLAGALTAAVATA
ncbi:winged helix DNA-binding domain-containing protein [Streptacidiphilus sp. ASG 303]|uniref:winged helix-turn-helix domain-containing protein n=1 Tax=Streptacidiphilus sp. ASG 303 TaxID=2896847 RepID=UPI001E546388|nr:crosslink repair DNA glycosylase YcaQ family protein [Streptacidiphilus sp. ASG 303]MCD0486267.1 winged helix DNA-binding domain-containing protein [Streptacidiphilus sp. ASG 303]